MELKKKIIASALVGAAAGVAGYKLGKKHRSASVRSSVSHNQIAQSRPIEEVKASDVGFEEYGHLKTFNIDKSKEISVLITGAGSYIGESFKEYVLAHYPNITITTLDMQKSDWKQNEVWKKGFDTVFHVAGIAHADVGNTSVEVQERYYKVNTDLAIEVCQKAAEAGCKQFIMMSSMIVYGGAERVSVSTLPNPTNFYGNSKWLADVGVRKVGGEMAVAVLRPPMIYGKGSKGNYPTLAKLAKRVPVFPKVRNKRSMLYIENLCEFVSLLALSQSSGIFFPQNSSYSNTGEVVRSIGEVSGSKVRLLSWLTPGVWLAERVPIKKIRGLAEKAFDSSYYDQELSIYDGIDYQKISLEESIRRTES